MNTLTKWENRENRWNPFKEMEELQNRLASMFGRLPVRREADGEETMTVSEWAPLVDITEDEKEYLITADLPEVRKEDLRVTVENGVLTITGERKFEKEETKRRYHRVERAYGIFTRSFALPEDADPSQVKAAFKDGVLKVHLTKDEKAKPKAIDIKVA
jgi:HSP20 family protein